MTVIEHLCKAPEELTELAVLSRSIFNQYEEHTKEAITALLNIVIPREETNSLQALQHKLQEKEDIIIRQYQRLQAEAFYAGQASQKDYDIIMSKIAAMTEINTLKMPLQKIAAYKKMLATFHSLRKSRIKA